MSLTAHKALSPGLAGKLAGASRWLADFVLPPACPVCSGRVVEAGLLCAGCWRGLDMIEAPLCDKTGLPFAYDHGEGALSLRAHRQMPRWDRARAAVIYGQGARQLVHGLKYRDRHDVAALLAAMMARAGRDLLQRDALLVPVPLYRLRLWQRRFNQSALLAGRIAHISGLDWQPALLARTRATRTQVGLDKAARKRNVEGAFQVMGEKAPLVAGRRIVIIDDVVTTGATANACAAALLAARAEAVDVLSFALVGEGSSNHI